MVLKTLERPTIVGRLLIRNVVPGAAGVLAVLGSGGVVAGQLMGTDDPLDRLIRPIARNGPSS